MKTLEEQICEAYEALDKSVPESYHETFLARLEKRLEVQAMEPETPDKPRDKASSEATSSEGTADAGSGTKENTGLHDIKAMARTTKARISQRVSTQSDVEESLLVSSSSGLKAVVLPEPGRDKPSYESEAAVPEAAGDAEEARGGLPFWVYGAVGAVAIAAVVFFVVRGRGGDEQKTAALDRAERPSAETMPGAALGDPRADEIAAADDQDDDAPAEPTAGDEPAPTVSPISPEEDGAAGGVASKAAEPVAVAAPEGKRDRRSDRRRSKKAKDKGSDKRKPSAAPKADSKPAPPPPADKPARGPRSLEDILDTEMGPAPGAGKTGKDPAKPVKKAPANTELGGSDIRTGMRSVLGRVQACYTQHKKSGTVKVSVTVAPSGSVAKASATGSFAGSKTGNCVATAVKSAKFPAWDGRAKAFKYSYLLSD